MICADRILCDKVFCGLLSEICEFEYFCYFHTHWRVYRASCPPGQKRGHCGHAIASFDGHSFCVHCRDKGKGKDPCVETPQSECKLCIVLTPDKLAQLATPSYKLKKEKLEAKKLESTPSKDSSLVDPSTIAVIGAVSEAGTVISPCTVVPEKKAKKDKPSTSKVKKSAARKSVSDSKYDELDKKWTDRFNKLEALLMAKTFQPTFSSAVKVTPSHSPPATIPKDSEPFFQPTSAGHTVTDSSAFMHKSASQPGWDSRLSSSQDHHLPSALVLTPLLNISQPTSLNQTDTSKDLHLISTLARTPLLPSICRPASFSLTGTDTQSTLVLTPLPPDINLPVYLSLTDQSHHWPPTPAYLHYIDRNRTVSPA